VCRFSLVLPSTYKRIITDVLLARLITQLERDSAFMAPVLVSDLWVGPPLLSLPLPNGRVLGFPDPARAGDLRRPRRGHPGPRRPPLLAAGARGNGGTLPTGGPPSPPPHPWDRGHITLPIVCSVNSPPETGVKAGAGIKIVIHNAFCLLDQMFSRVVGTFSFLNIISIFPHLSPIPGRWQPTLCSSPLCAIRLSLSVTRLAPCGRRFRFPYNVIFLTGPLPGQKIAMELI